MKLYLTIGEMAKMFNISSQTLQFYDRQKLFVPEIRDENTGYRKYAFEQIYSLSLICYLRKIGFSIERIKGYLNLRNADSTIKQLKDQSEALKLQYTNLLNIDSVIQRKIKFVEDKIEHMNVDDIFMKHLPKRAYIPLGVENVLYNNETFYFFPTIAFYTYLTDSNSYDKTFGAYIEPDVTIPGQYDHKIKFIEEQDFLCFYNQGAYKKIAAKIDKVKREHSNLKLSSDSINFNIIDQFLEKDMDKYITEIQIPIIT